MASQQTMFQDRTNMSSTQPQASTPLTTQDFAEMRTQSSEHPLRRYAVGAVAKRIDRANTASVYTFMATVDSEPLTILILLVGQCYAHERAGRPVLRHGDRIQLELEHGVIKSDEDTLALEFNDSIHFEVLESDAYPAGTVVRVTPDPGSRLEIILPTQKRSYSDLVAPDSTLVGDEGQPGEPTTKKRRLEASRVDDFVGRFNQARGFKGKGFKYGSLSSLKEYDKPDKPYTHNILAVVIDVRPVIATTSGDVSRTFYLVDPSILSNARGQRWADGGHWTVFCFASKAEDLPSAEPGDVIAFRSLELRHDRGFKNSMGRKDRMLWAVYSAATRTFSSSAVVSTTSTQQDGANNDPPRLPRPYQAGSDEKRYADGLLSWFCKTMNERKDCLDLEGSGPDLNDLGRREHLLFSEASPDNDPPYFDATVELLDSLPPSSRDAPALIYVADYTSNARAADHRGTSDPPKPYQVYEIEIWGDSRTEVDKMKKGAYYMVRNLRMRLKRRLFVPTLSGDGKISLCSDALGELPAFQALLRRKAAFGQSHDAGPSH